MYLQDECVEPMKHIAEQINSHSKSISTHLRLSMFKVAQVDVIPPKSNASCVFQNFLLCILLLLIKHIMSN